MSRVISQKKFTKGLVANAPDQSQPPGSVSRISNMIYTRRGGLRTCDGSLIISLLNGTLQSGTGPWTELFLFQPVNISRYYIGIKKDYTSHIAIPTLVSAVDAGAGGTLGAGTYGYGLTALDGAGGETTEAGPINVVIAANHKVTFTWNSVTNAAGGYNVYRTTAGGIISFFLTTVPGQASTSFTDDGSIALGTGVPPATNQTQQMLFYRIPATSYGAGNILATLPADPFIPQDGTPGGTGQGGGTTNPSSGNPPTPQGGNVGNTSPLPQIVQFANKGFLALGNGFAPQVFTDPSTVAAVTNTFSAIYPDWVAAQIFAVGDLIKPTVNNAGGFVFKCLQGGTAGAGPVTWPQTANTTITDPKLLWDNVGVGTASPAPRGAAHVEVYAGALWVANTSPTTTADNLDGPSALRMSDINNPTSWNPLNTAFLDRDDGDQVTGLKAMTIAESGIPPTGSLCAFKNFKTFQINGVFGSSNFSIQRAQTDLGCIASRTIEFCPGFGIIRLSHLGFALFDTTRDRIISEDIRPFLFADPSITDITTMDWNFSYLSKAAQTANPPMYCCATPLALGNIPTTGAGGIAFTFAAGASTFVINQLYFFRVTKFTVVGGVTQETALSQEVNFVLNALTLTVSATGTLDPAAVKYRVYIGTQSGGYTSFAEFTTLPQTFTGPGSFPTSGSIINGIGGLTRLFCYDLVQKAWAVIDLPYAISTLKQVRPLGSQPLTIVGGFSDGAVRRIQSGDATWDGTPVSWSVRPAELMSGGGSGRVFYARVTLKGVGNPSTITITPSYDYADDIVQQPTNYTLGASRFESWLDLLQTALTAHVNIAGTGPVELDSADWEVEPLPEGAPVQFA